MIIQATAAAKAKLHPCNATMPSVHVQPYAECNPSVPIIPLRIPLPALLIQTTRILSVPLIDARFAIFDRIEQCLFHVPVVLLRADRELEILARYAVPVLLSVLA